ncbi:MAG: DNA polymerase III subunit delta [Oscillospiraceae bacterium]|nr:DNA polymerase III subunit delta [Oscillospiraceae bacterium]
MSETSINELKRQLKSGETGSFYILYGEEAYLKEHYLAQLRKSVLGADDDPFNLRRFDGRSISADELAEAIDAFPSFAERCFVEVRDYDLFKAPADEAARLEEILSSVPDYCCLVFVYDLTEYKPDKRRKLYGVIKDRAAEVNVPTQEQGALERWVEKHFEHYGKKISRENAKYLIFLCGELMDTLNNEITKVAFYSSGAEVTRADIDAAASPTVDAVAYDLTSALSAKNFDGAAEVMSRLFRLSEEPIKLLALIGNQMRRLYYAYMIKNSGGGVGEIKTLLGLRSDYPAKMLSKNCSSFSGQWHRRMLRLCAETDLKLKSSAGDPQQLLTDLFLEMASGERRENVR